MAKNDTGLCDRCGKPLAADAHFNTKYCRCCASVLARRAQARSVHAYYHQHAEALRERRRLKYRQSKQRQTATEQADA
jgi:predicted amidophosphoribosyltransferase